MSAFRGSASPTQSWNHFRFAVNDGVATLTFDRPQKLNALTFQVYADLRDLLTELPQRDDVRVLVITGTGRGFSSGGDVTEIIGELQKMDPRDLLAFARMTGTVTQRMRDCPLPIIASVNGVAAGAGAVIALAADLRILARSATFSFLFTKVGLSGGDMGAAYLLPRLIGLGRASELLLLGEPITSDRALAIGLANAAVEDSELSAASSEVAGRLARGPALAYQTAQRPDGPMAGGTMAEQFDLAATNVVLALEAAGAHPHDLVSMQIFVTHIDEYLRASKEIGEVYRRHFGRHYPAMALLEVRRLSDPAAKIELMCISVTA